MPALAEPRRILVVDDHQPTRKALAMIARQVGYHVDDVATVSEAVEKLPAQPAIILLDLNLPDGLGTTILARIRGDGLPVKVAVVSGTNDASLLAEVARLKPDAVFPKPPDITALMEWLQTV